MTFSARRAILAGRRLPALAGFGPVLLCAVVGALAFTAAPALAASPEPPELHAEPVFATAATFHGVLNPHGTPSEAGSYQFVYRRQTTAGEDKCKGTGETKAPAAPVAAKGGGVEHEELPAQTVSGLKENTEYAVCLLAENGEGKATSSSVAFKTTVPVPLQAPAEVAVEQHVPSPAAPSKEAVFRGVLSPASSEANEGGTYEFLYKASTTKVCTGGGATAPGLAFGGPDEALPAETVKGLIANTEYAVCLSVTNFANTETFTSPAVSFKTAIKPETPNAEKVKTGSITATTAEVEGELNPGKVGEAGSFEFLYKVSPTACEGGEATGAEPASGAVTEVVGPAKLENLQPNAKYTFCLRAHNEAGEEAIGAPVTFTTLTAPLAILSESVASPVPATSATLEANINPNNEPTKYAFEYSRKASGEVLEAPITTVPGASGLSGFGEQTASVPTQPLTQDTTYYYRVVAENTSGKAKGEVEHFNTAPENPVEVEVPAADITGQTAKLKGVLSPHTNGEVGASYEFLYNDDGGCEGGSRTSGTSKGNSPEAVEAEITELVPNKEYAVCLRVRDAAGASAQSEPPVTFTTSPAPIVAEEAVSNVEAKVATLRAQINPDGSEVSSCTFEYGEGTGYGKQVPCVTAHGEPIGAGTEPVPFSAQLSGLEPNTSYEYRVVAVNPIGTSYGPAKIFSTPAAPGSEPAETCSNRQLREEQPYGLDLPDCRAYELVSPTDTNGQDATSYNAEASARASGAPEGTEPAVVYSSKGSFEAPEGALLENQYLSRRTPAGWATQNTTPLFTAASSEEPNSTYPTTYFTPELTAGLAVTSAQLGEAPPLGEHYGVYLAQFADHSYRYAGPIPAKEPPWGASTDLERVVLTRLGNGSLVEQADGTEVPVSVTNTGTELAASAGSAQYAAGSYEKDAWHSTSEDGSRVYFTTPFEQESEIARLFVRVNIGQPQSAVGVGGECLKPTGACTIEVSASKRKPADPVGPRSARYWGASANGEKVFFTSDSELTQNAYTGVKDKAANLYEYDLATHELTDLTVDDADITEGAAVQGVVQISEDGSYVYFVADGKLAAGAVQGESNLYVSHDGEAPGFIATLTAIDHTDWINVGARKGAGPEVNTAVVNPSGSELAFISERGLPTVNFPTGYDSEQTAAGECQNELEDQELESGMCREVYLYNSETQTMVCASCNPSGARPVGPSSLPGVNVSYNASADYRPRDLLANGTLFFNSKDALASGSSGGRRNVYEFEDGAVHAISAVSGGFESFFLDASPDGRNVFFASADRLLPEDPGGNTVVWDARQDGGFPVTATGSEPCESGEACQRPAATPPAVGPPASATFSGPGNPAPVSPAPAIVPPKPKTTTQVRAEKLAKALKICRKDKNKTQRQKTQRQTCEKQAKRKYGPAQKKKASNKRRPKS
jgi:hypothetical protein